MRMMLGPYKHNPSLLVDVGAPYDPLNFDFFVVNGSWNGKLINNEVYVEGDKTSTGVKIFILCTDQKVLNNGGYNEVFETYDLWLDDLPIKYLPKPTGVKDDYDDDDIPF